MTYLVDEQSTQDGVPVFLVMFSRGSENYYYTNNTRDIFYGDGAVLGLTGPVNFQAMPIRVGAVKSGKELPTASLDFTFPVTNDFALSFIEPYVRDLTFVILWRAHKSDYNDLAVYWRGRVVAGVLEKDQKIKLACENFMSRTKRIGLRAKYQKSCRHVLYGPECGVSYDTIKEAITITAVSSTGQLTIANDKADGYYRGGILQIGTLFGFITYHVGNQMRLHTPMANAIAGATGFIAPGCDLSIQTCESKFNNRLRHGGFPFIPAKSPYGGADIYVIGG